MWPNNGCQVFSSSCKMSHFMVSQHFLHGRAFRSSSSSFACCSELPLWHLDNKVCGLSQHISVSMFIFSSTISYCQLCSTSLSKQEKEQIFPLPVATALVQMSLTVSLNAHTRQILNSLRIIFHFQAAPKENRSKNSLFMLSAHRRHHITK